MSKNDTKTPEPVAAAPAAAQPSVTFTKEELSKFVSEVATNAAMAATMAQGQLAQNQAMAAFKGRQLPEHGPRCQECGQFEVACKKQHVKMIVFPANRKAQKYFQGVKVNGVVYDSGAPGRKITVPAENDIQKILEMMNEQEEQFSNGRTGHWNSGSIGKGAKGFRPADGIGWR